MLLDITHGNVARVTDGITRRKLIRDGALAGGAVVAGGALRPAASYAGRRTPVRRRVAVLGGGVAGLSAAQELAERGFAVTVYERRALGGKARSVDVEGTATGGRMPLPGEHGMRFFPGFYTNLPDTMRRIPDGTNPNGTFDNLVAASQFGLARDGGREDVLLPVTPNPVPWRLEQLRPSLIGAIQQLGAFPPGEAEHFVERLLVFMTSCDERRLGEWEPMSWWEFVGAASRSEDYRRVLVNSVTRQLLAAKADRASTRTLGLLWEAFLLNLTGQTGTGSFDRVLDGPTNEALIDPWVAHLRSLGVDFEVGWKVRGLAFRDGSIRAARVRRPDGRQVDVAADWFVLAIPVERARPVLSARIKQADPALARTRSLVTDWMNGMQVYLREPRPILHGHVFYCDSPWALSSISQAQFWPERDFAKTYGDGTVTDCFSIDIGDFNTPGPLYGQPARRLGPAQIKAEVLAQIRAHLDDTGDEVLPDAIIHSVGLDPGLKFEEGVPRSQDPLLINTPGSLESRPPAATAIPNLLLASDYVRTSVDVACMEGANEAARRAVNALLERSGSATEPCTVTELYKPPELEALKRVDSELYARGLPNALDVAS